MSFYVDKNGKSIRCDILALLPGNNDNETYIAFTDYEEKENNDHYIQYALVIKDNDNYRIEEFEDEDIVSRLKELVADKIAKYTFDYLENNYE